MDKFEIINTNKIEYNPSNPRLKRTIDIENLAQNIQQVGLLNPILVKPQKDKYILIDGERRLRAIKFLGHETIKCIVTTDIKNDLLCQLSICLNNRGLPIFPDKAKAVYELQTKLNMKNQQLAEYIGMDRTYIARLNKIWIALGKGIDEEKLPIARLISTRIAAKFNYLTKDEKLIIVEEIEHLLDKRIISFKQLEKNFKYFNNFTKQEEQVILKNGFISAINWIEDIQKYKIQQEIALLPFNEVYSRLLNLITKINLFFDNIEKNIYDLDKSQIFAIQLLLKPLSLQLARLLKESNDD